MVTKGRDSVSLKNGNLAKIELLMVQKKENPINHKK
jgi:hypothetical protein